MLKMEDLVLSVKFFNVVSMGYSNCILVFRSLQHDIRHV